MANPLFEALNGSRSQQGSRQNMAPALLQHIQNFRGDPVQAVQSKLDSGEWTQAQYDQLRPMAEELASRMMRVLRR